MSCRATKKVTTGDSVTLHRRYLYRSYLQIACCDLKRSGHPCLWHLTWDPTQPVATRPLALRKDGTWYTYGWDLTKNICEVYKTNGGIGTAYTYTPYGEVSTTGNVTQPIQWFSEYADTELGLTYYNYRHYNPSDGRWLQRDFVEAPAGFNVFLYTLNHPIILFDALGLCESKCCKDGRRYKTVTDDAGRNCCEYEVQEVSIQVQPSGNYLKREVGHAWVKTPNIQRGFYPDSWHRGVLGAGKGVVRNDDSSQIPNENKHTPNSANSYFYKACPDSVSELEKRITESEQNPPEYSLYNNGDARNCCGWACDMMKKSGFAAPFAPNTFMLAPAAPGYKGYGNGRRPKKH